MNIRRTLVALTMAVIPMVSQAGQTLDWLLRPVFGLHYSWGLEVSSMVSSKCADDVTFSWGPTRSQFSGMVNGTGRTAKKCGGTGHIGGMAGAVPAEPFVAKWKDWSGVVHSASVDIAQVMGPTEVYGGDLKILLNNDRLEVWFSAPDKSRSALTATFWPKRDAVLVYSTDPNLSANVWTFRLDTRGLDFSKNDVLSDFWMEWGTAELSGLRHAGAQKRTFSRSYTGFSTTIMYESLPTVPLELHWKDPAGIQRDFSVPVAQSLAGERLGGGRLFIVAYPTYVELWFEKLGAIAGSPSTAKVLVYKSPQPSS